MDTAKYIQRKYNIKTDVIEIPNVGRDDLAGVFHELDFKRGAEIGVAAGEYSEIIMQANPQLEKMYGVDPYISYENYKDYVRKSTFNKLMEDAHGRLDKYPAYEFIRATSVEAAQQIEDGSLDFVYIDANHQTDFVKQDIEAWAPKVRKDGIVAGHDYARIRPRTSQESSEWLSSKNWGVIPAIKGYTKDNNLDLYIWGLEAKIGLKRDSSRSWMFIR